jgi:hypothetical protein
MEPLFFTATLEQDKDGTWWYAHAPKEIRQALKQLEVHGTIPVEATIGHTTWVASLLPWADGSAQIVIKKLVRDKERLKLGDTLEITVRQRTAN